MRVLIFAAAVLLATGLHARSEEAKPQAVQWVLTLRLPSAIWNPGIYSSEERCEAARRRANRAVRGFVCVELLSP